MKKESNAKFRIEIIKVWAMTGDNNKPVLIGIDAADTAVPTITSKGILLSSNFKIIKVNSNNTPEITKVSSLVRPVVPKLINENVNNPHNK